MTRLQNSLTKPGTEPALFLEARDYPFHHVTKAISEFKKELSSQIELLGKWLGGIDKIDHVSNHHGVAYIDLDLFEAYTDVVTGYNIPIRSPMIWSQSHLDYFNKPLLEPPFPWQVNPLTKYGIYKLKWGKEFFESIRFKKKVEITKQKGLIIPHCNNDCIYGLPYEKNIITMIEQYEKVDMTAEFMFHLGFFDQDPHLIDVNSIETPNGIDNGYFGNRMLEFALLRQMDISTVLSAYGIEKVVFRDLNKNDWEKKILIS